jgi:anti-sigma B factor antagonist
VGLGPVVTSTTRGLTVSPAPHLHPPTLPLAVVAVPPECLVAVAGELDLASAPALGDTLCQLDPGCEVVTLDLRALTFLDVAGLHALVDARSLARATGGRLQILAPRGEAARVLELTGTRALVS